MNIELWQPYLISTVIGLLIGIEREKAHPSAKAMGVRTFVLVALMGAVAGSLQSPWLIGLITSFALGLVVISYFNVTQKQGKNPDIGLTTEFAAGIVFCLGFISHTRPLLTTVLGPLVALVLISKTPLHRFTNRIKSSEIQAALLLLLVAVTVINLLEDKVIDPWGVFNPRKFGLLILVLAGVEFASYVLTKILGNSSSALMLGFLGGLVSSTAILLSSARRAAKEPKTWRREAVTAIASKVAALLEVLFIVMLISPPLLIRLLIPVGAVTIVASVVLWLLASKITDHSPGHDLRSPLDWPGVLRLALLLGVILALIAIVQKLLGSNATLAVSFIGGLFELHGISMANSTMVTQAHLPESNAYFNILVAITASLVAKIALAYTALRGPYTYATTATFIAMIAVLWFTQFIQSLYL